MISSVDNVIFSLICQFALCVELYVKCEVIFDFQACCLGQQVFETRLPCF